MSWRDAESHEDDPLRGFGRPGGDWQGVRPSFDNPLSWSLPLGRLGAPPERFRQLLGAFATGDPPRMYICPPWSPVEIIPGSTGRY